MKKSVGYGLAAIAVGGSVLAFLIWRGLSERPAEGKRFVTFQGVRMIEGWPEKIKAAQAVSTYTIGGKSYKRIPYGKEEDDWGADRVPCHDCAVIKGQLHVPGCDVEQCPCCGGQAIGCDCERSDEEDGE